MDARSDEAERDIESESRSHNKSQLMTEEDGRKYRTDLIDKGIHTKKVQRMMSGTAANFETLLPQDPDGRYLTYCFEMSP